MELAPADVPLSFEVTFDRNDLNVAMSVYDDTGASPVLVSGPTAMALVSDYTYRAKFTAADGRNYIVIKAVYTDGSFLVLNPDYSQGSESIVAQNIGGGSSAPASGVLLGIIIPNDTVLGFVSDSSNVIGLISC